MKAPQTLAAEAKRAQEDLLKKQQQIANDQEGLLARSDPYQSRVGFTSKQLQGKSDARLAKDLRKVHKEGKADKKLARQLQRAAQNTDAIGDPYDVPVEKPRAKLGKSGKDIATRQARVASRRDADAKLLRRMQQLQGSVGRRPAP